MSVTVRDSAPDARADTATHGERILEVDDLTMHFPVRKGLLRRVVGHVRAVDGVSFHIGHGETLGLVGESGCGKSTIGRLIMRLYRPTTGAIRYRGRDIASLEGDELNAVRREMQIVFQDPFASLNPRFRVGEIVGEAYRVHTGDRAWREHVADLLAKVGLQPTHMNRYPHEFSGGQRQRICIARALAMSPRLVVADEPVSALDVSIQAQVINLLDSLKAELGFSFLFIAHDLSVVEHIADRIAVMYLGKMVELASDRDLYQDPLHPYTEALIAAVPKPEAGARRRKRTVLRGDVPSPLAPPPGCRFHTRCPKAMPECSKVEPVMREAKPRHWVACHLFPGEAPGD
ncbi:MAG: ABC transporter ATP-binding protein [Ectothiorhodospiraceae bacterium]|nr:ABC transporter ATP-binding protein [Ectothiorhodospiraceae bacterium]